MTLPNGFVYVEHPNIRVEMVYASNNNFFNTTLPGYIDNVGIVTHNIYKRLCVVADELFTLGYGLVLYDAYRPEQARHFIEQWMKSSVGKAKLLEKYPDMKHETVIGRYIEAAANHSKGSTIDVGLYHHKTGALCDMGGEYGLYDGRIVEHSQLSEEASKNRKLLCKTMRRHQIYGSYYAWWQFSTHDDTFANRAFTFEIEAEQSSPRPVWSRFCCCFFWRKDNNSIRYKGPFSLVNDQVDDASMHDAASEMPGSNSAKHIASGSIFCIEDEQDEDTKIEAETHSPLKIASVLREGAL